jgi:hypothetical protein
LGIFPIFGTSPKLTVEIRMGKESTQFKEGNPGKPKGAVNKSTKAAKEVFISIMEGEVDNIKVCLDKIRKEDPALYLATLSKFYPYYMPKKMEVDTPSEITINVKRRD